MAESGGNSDDSISIAGLKADTCNDWSWALMAIVLSLAALECFMAMRFGHYKRGRRVFVELAPDTSLAMRRYFAEAGSIVAI